jgi:capsular exopolysaccharide synthesis family protein
MSLENNNGADRQEEEIDIKKIIYLLLRQWHWFVLFGVLGLGGAYVYNKLTKTKYSVVTSILVPEKSKGIDMKSLFEGAMDQGNNNIYNQIEIIKSYYTINQTLLNLNWRTSWYKKDFLIWRGIYKQEPFDVQEGPNFINPKGLAVNITPTKNDTYTISVNGKANLNNQPVTIEFEAEAQYGRPFVNEYFNFTLLKKINSTETPEGSYYFVFNDLNDATKAYQAKLNAVLKDKNSDIIQCTLQGEEPVKEGEFLNELIKVYVEGKMNFQNESQRRSLDFINSQLTGISDSLNSASTKFTEFRSKNKIIDLGAEGTLVMENLKELESEGAKNQIQLDYFRDLLNYLNNNDIKQMVSPSVVGIQDVSLNALVLKLGELYNRRQVVSFSAKENNPTLLLIDKEMTQTRNQLSENLRNLIDNATRSINSQKDRQASISFQLNKLPQKEQQMINIQRQFDLTNEIYTFLLQKRAETNIALASSLPDVQVIDIARPETATPIGLSSKMVLIIGFILGLMLPLAFILLINFFDDRIRTQEDVENHTQLPILGNVMHSPINSDMAVFENPKSNIAESFRALRTNLQFMLPGSEGKIVSIHSTNPGEGKSFGSVNLATIIAMNNRKVLIIGADLRKPRLHKIFDLPNEHGLSTYLIGYDTAEQIVFPTIIPNLSVMPAGPIPPNPAEILGKPEMKSLLEKLRTQFDFIIIDNAPVGLVTDGIIMSFLCDLNVFILRYGISHKHQLEMINQYAAKKTIENIALVVNDIKTNAFGYTYYKYYQYEAYQKTYYSAEDQGVKTRRIRKTKNGKEMGGLISRLFENMKAK